MEDSVNLNRQIHISSSNGLHPLLKVLEPGRMGRSGVVEEGPQGGKKIQRGHQAALQIISGMIEEKTSLAWPMYLQTMGQFTFNKP